RSTPRAPRALNASSAAGAQRLARSPRTHAARRAPAGASKGGLAQDGEERGDAGGVADLPSLVPRRASIAYAAWALIGELFNGKYRVLRLLGQGGMGSVYEVELVETGERLALKCVESELLSRSKTSVGRFQREVRAMGSLDTEHIVRVR